jgi:hypothetical protein
MLSPLPIYVHRVHRVHDQGLPMERTTFHKESAPRGALPTSDFNKPVMQPRLQTCNHVSRDGMFASWNAILFHAMERVLSTGYLFSSTT